MIDHLNDRKAGVAFALDHFKVSEGDLRAVLAAALEKEKTLVKYAREYITMGDECLKHDMKEAAMRNYEKAVALCPKFKEAWQKIKKLDKDLKKAE